MIVCRIDADVYVFGCVGGALSSCSSAATLSPEIMLWSTGSLTGKRRSGSSVRMLCSTSKVKLLIRSIFVLVCKRLRNDTVLCSTSRVNSEAFI